MVELQTSQPAASAQTAQNFKSPPSLLPSLSTAAGTAVAGATTASAPQPGHQSSISRMPNRLKVDSYFSPVNENGSFEFDRVIKSGYLQRRTKTKTWKSVFVVLRPNTLSIYKTNKEDRLQNQVFLSELTAVTFLKDPKQKRQHVFGLFSSSRDYHFQASSDAEAQEWVDRIRTEARIEEEEEEMFLASPAVHRQAYNFPSIAAAAARWQGGTNHAGNVTQATHPQNPILDHEHQHAHQHEHERFASSSPEPQDITPRRPAYQRPPQNSIIESSGWSGNELASDDYSDADMHMPTLGPSFGDAAGPSPSMYSAYPLAADASWKARNTSQASGVGSSLENDPDRVIWQGWMWYLRSRRGVRQWKKSWAVLRPRNLILYKDASEYTAKVIVPLSSVISVVERDPMSRSKQHCMQIITEEKSYQFSADDEETLLLCLGAFKSLLAKRKELEVRAAAAVLAPTTTAFAAPVPVATSVPASARTVTPTASAPAAPSAEYPAPAPPIAVSQIKV